MVSEIQKLKIEIDLLNYIDGYSLDFIYELLNKKECELAILSEMMLDNLSEIENSIKFDKNKVSERHE